MLQQSADALMVGPRSRWQLATQDETPRHVDGITVCYPQAGAWPQFLKDSCSDEIARGEVPWGLARHLGRQAMITTREQFENRDGARPDLEPCSDRIASRDTARYAHLGDQAADDQTQTGIRK